MTANVKNYVDQAGSDRDNVVHIEGSLRVLDNGFSPTKLANVLNSNDFRVYSSSDTNDIEKNGYTVFFGGTGYTREVESPEPGAVLNLTLRAITSGTVIIKTKSGVTWDGTNNTATFTNPDDSMTAGYFSTTQFEIYSRTGVTLSST